MSWTRYTSYNKAKKCRKCVYVLKYNRTPKYIGKAKNFGGSNGRYNSGYSYLIRLLLRKGFKLYIWKFKSLQWEKESNNYEKTLIKRHRRTVLNEKLKRGTGKFKEITNRSFLDIRQKQRRDI
jgi:hypothetical protein